MSPRSLVRRLAGLLAPEVRGFLVPMVIVAVVVAACSPTAAPLASGETAAPTASASLPPGAHPLTPAPLGADPFSLLSWLFTPVFQVFFIGLVLLDKLVGNIAIAIVLLTIIIKLLLTPIFRRQIVSTRRMQLISPEVKEVQRRYKADRAKQQQALQALYRERGISPTAGCLPTLLQMFLLIPMYSVFSQGLQNYDVQPMLDVFGFRILDLACDAAPEIVQLNGQPHVANPCLNPIAFGINWGVPEVFIGTPGAILGGLSLLALISSLLQLVQSRMALPAGPVNNDDPNAKTQRQMAIFLPFISLIYGPILPAGLFLYWIVSTIVSIIQQFLTTGWGGMFPFLGWTPAFAVDHNPRFPVAVPPATMSTTRETGAVARPTPPRSTPADRAASAASTVRPSQRGRQGRRGRRR